MKKFLMLASISCVLFGALAGAAFAQSAPVSASASAVPSVTFLPPLSVTKTADLAFGTWAASPSKVYAIGADATASMAGATATYVSGTRTAAAFRATGTANSNVTWTFPSTVTVSAGSNSFAITLVPPSGATGSTFNTALDANGVSTVLVGGAFTSGATAPLAATYTNATGFTVTVAYQ